MVDFMHSNNLLAPLPSGCSPKDGGTVVQSPLEDSHPGVKAAEVQAQQWAHFEWAIHSEIALKVVRLSKYVDSLHSILTPPLRK